MTGTFTMDNRNRKPLGSPVPLLDPCSCCDPAPWSFCASITTGYGCVQQDLSPCCLGGLQILQRTPQADPGHTQLLLSSADSQLQPLSYPGTPQRSPIRSTGRLPFCKEASEEAQPHSHQRSLGVCWGVEAHSFSLAASSSMVSLPEEPAQDSGWP